MMWVESRHYHTIINFVLNIYDTDDMIQDINCKFTNLLLDICVSSSDTLLSPLSAFRRSM